MATTLPGALTGVGPPGKARAEPPRATQSRPQRCRPQTAAAAAKQASPRGDRQPITSFPMAPFNAILCNSRCHVLRNETYMLTSDEENAQKQAAENAAPFERALAFYRESNTCPCAFPRYAQIVSFDSRKFGLPFPMANLDSEILVGLSITGAAAFFQKAGNELKNVAPLRC